MIKVFYDGMCSLCSREIAYYKRLAPTKKFEWIDVNTNPDKLKTHSLNQIETLKVLHVIDSNGNISRGVEAFRIIWDNLPGWWIASKFLSIRWIKFLAESIYNIFARRRFSRLEHCQLSLKKNITS